MFFKLSDNFHILISHKTSWDKPKISFIIPWEPKWNYIVNHNNKKKRKEEMKTQLAKAQRKSRSIQIKPRDEN